MNSQLIRTNAMNWGEGTVLHFAFETELEMKLVTAAAGCALLPLSLSLSFFSLKSLFDIFLSLSLSKISL